MTIIDYVCVAITLLSLAFAGKFYLELWRWARMCQSAQIAVAYKRKVKLSAPLVEWLLWCNQVDEGKGNGRVVYNIGGTSVAILRGRVSAKRSILSAIKLGVSKRKRTGTPPAPSGHTIKQGSWSASDDRTGAKTGVRT